MSEGRREGERLVREGRREGEWLVREGRREGEWLVSEGRREGEWLVSEGRREGEWLVREGRREGEWLVREGRREGVATSLWSSEAPTTNEHIMCAHMHTHCVHTHACIHTHTLTGSSAIFVSIMMSLLCDGVEGFWKCSSSA